MSGKVELVYDIQRDAYIMTHSDGKQEVFTSEQLRQLNMQAAMQQTYHGPGSRQWGKQVNLPGPDVLDFWINLYYGTVVRWTMHRRFTYTAVKVRSHRNRGELWYTSATEDNPMVQQILTTEELFQLFIHYQADIITVEIAESWRSL